MLTSRGELFDLPGKFWQIWRKDRGFRFLVETLSKASDGSVAEAQESRYVCKLPRYEAGSEHRVSPWPICSNRNSDRVCTLR